MQKRASKDKATWPNGSFDVVRGLRGTAGTYVDFDLGLSLYNSFRLYSLKLRLLGLKAKLTVDAPEHETAQMVENATEFTRISETSGKSHLSEMAVRLTPP